MILASETALAIRMGELEQEVSRLRGVVRSLGFAVQLQNAVYVKHSESLGQFCDEQVANMEMLIHMVRELDEENKR